MKATLKINKNQECNTYSGRNGDPFCALTEKTFKPSILQVDQEENPSISGHD